jgi:hypothetical protein
MATFFRWCCSGQKTCSQGGDRRDAMIGSIGAGILPAEDLPHVENSNFSSAALDQITTLHRLYLSDALQTL